MIILNKLPIRRDVMQFDSNRFMTYKYIQLTFDITNPRVWTLTLLQDYNRFFKEFDWLVCYNKGILMNLIG